ncbi:MAG: hypothetical protein R3C43_08450 [Chloroflexota bacterium]
MRNNRSLITWLIIFAILVGSGLLTILLPSFFGGGSSTSLPSDPTIVTFPLPVPIGGRSEITLASWQWMLGLAVLIPGLVIGAGLTLGIIYIILSRLAINATSSTAYQKNVAALEKKESEKISKLRETRPTSVAPESTWNRWAVITTGITIAMFVAFLTLLLASLLFPGGQVVRNDAIVNATSALVFIAVAIALTAVGLWFRSERITAINRTESLAIPWDFLAIVFSGLLVVGLGIGVIVILNAPQ